MRIRVKIFFFLIIGFITACYSQKTTIGNSGIHERQALAIADAFVKKQFTKDGNKHESKFNLKYYPNRKALFHKKNKSWTVLYARHRWPGDHFTIVIENEDKVSMTLGR